MKKVTLFTFTLFISFITFAQQKMSCCVMPSATAEFASLADDKAFIASHLEPLPYQYDEDLGRMIDFKTPDGKKGYGFEILTNYQGSDMYLFIFPEFWGLNDYMKLEAAHYFKELKNVNVIVLDLYDGKVAKTREQAQQYMSDVNDDRVRSIIQGAINHVGKDARIATVGWCFGGGWSLQASIMAGDQAAGCVMYYGMPEKNVERLKRLQTDVLGIFALKDQWITPALVLNFQRDMEVAGKNLTVKNYEEDHAFANPSNPKYSKKDAGDAYTEAIHFLKLHYAKKGNKDRKVEGK